MYVALWHKIISTINKALASDFLVKALFMVFQTIVRKKIDFLLS